MIQLPLAPERAARLLLLAHMRVSGGPGSGNFGHAGRPGVVGGSSSSREDLMSAARLYARHSIDNRKIAHVSRAIIQGEDIERAAEFAGAHEDHVSSAKRLVEEVRNAPESGDVLFRGIQTHDPHRRWDGSGLHTLKVGETVSIGKLTSFTEDEGTARDYMETHGDFQDKRGYTYLLKTQGTVKALKTDDLTQMTHKERVTFGKFTVESVSVTGKDHEITLRQVGVF